MRHKNTNKYREAALHFQKYNYYTSAPRGTTAYKSYWDEEGKRCLEGYTASDGSSITGYHYFYLNYCPIMMPKEKTVIDKRGRKRKIYPRERDFPDFWDSDYEYFHTVEFADYEGKHLVVLKARAKGYSFKNASMLCRNFFLIRESKSYAIAAESEFLIKDGFLTKAWDFIDFIDQHTAWTKKRQRVDTKIHKRASFVADIDGTKTEKGYKSEIIGISLKNDPQKHRGKRGKLILYEEGGKFPGLLQAWQIAQSSVESSGVAYGLMVAFGCVCKGTKVWNNRGELVNIEDLNKRDGILGYDGKRVSKEDITYWQLPVKKPCYRIITNTGRFLECSEDHPILWSRMDFGSQPRKPTKNAKRPFIKKTKFVEAKDVCIGDQVGVIEEVPLFGNKKMWEPRVVGWLIGDGSYGFDKTPVLSNCEEEINDYIDSKLDTIVEKQYITKIGKIYRETRIRGICQRLRELKIYGQTKLVKTLPENIHSYIKKDICELLGGFFDADGYVYRSQINASSMSFELLKEIQLLLQKIGIHGNIKRIKKNEKNSKDKNDYYRLTIADKRSVLKFADNIKLYPKIKKERLSQVYKHYSDKGEKISKNACGLRFERVVNIEYIGIQDVYNLTAGNTNTYIANGIVTKNTGGSEGSDYEGLKELFYSPNGYNALPLENKYDEGATKPCGYFVPEYMNMYGTDDDGNLLMDKDGNTNIEIARKYSEKLRQIVLKGASNKNAIDRYIAEHPFTPIEACLQISGNIFPKDELIRQLAMIRNSEKLQAYKQAGDLQWNEKGAVKWYQAIKPKDLTYHRLSKDDDTTGQIVIWEHPVDDPPYGLYIGGTDPYDHDKASSTESLGSTLIYKRFQNFEAYHNIIVAEYTGRPDTADEYYENVRKLLVYYNATLLFENERKGIYPYFLNRHCDFLLADQPDFINEIIKDSRVSRRKGIHMVVGIKDWAEIKVRDWLNEEFEPGRKNLTRIMSEPLLEELISYNDEGNFDRVIALMMIMIYKEQLHYLHVKKKKEIIKKRLLFPEPIFKKENVPLFINI